ncbi:MAG TPA: STAS domain-containing protein [Candidatus Baltobacteraceae bacterium]|jgi:rsbT co-antagonist protein RsbR
MARDTSSGQVASVVREKRDEIWKRWLKVIQSRSRGTTNITESQNELAPIFEAVLAGIAANKMDAEDPAHDELRALLSEYSRMRARHGYTPTQTALAIFALRDAILESVDDARIHAEFPPYSRFIDDLGLLTFESYSKTRESVIAGQTEQLMELSTPVVKLWEGILAIPLVGTLDSARTQVVMESLLQELVATGSAHAIIDITGVPAVDTEVAQHLLKTVFAARLMGAECIISGIRPQIAQTIVSLGIEFGDVATKATLESALRLTLTRAGFEVRRVAGAAQRT